MLIFAPTYNFVTYHLFDVFDATAFENFLAKLVSTALAGQFMLCIFVHDNLLFKSWG